MGGQYSLATATGLFKSTISMLMVVTANKIAAVRRVRPVLKKELCYNDNALLP